MQIDATINLPKTKSLRKWDTRLHLKESLFVSLKRITPPPSYLTDYDCSIQFLSPQKRDGHPVSVAFGRDKSAL